MIPPSGKYLDVRDGLVYEYDAATQTLVLTTDTSVNPTCYYGGPRSQCGECMYVPDSRSWQLDQPYVDNGACLNVEPHPQNNLGHYHATVRVDARIIDSTVWSYRVHVDRYGSYLDGPWRSNPSVTFPEEECLNREIIPGTFVNFCGEGAEYYAADGPGYLNVMNGADWNVKWVTGARAGLAGHFAQASNF